MWSKVGERVAKIRKSKNLSKAKFGELIGISGQYVGMIEKGAGISAETIVKICQAMCVSADYILFGNIDPASITNSFKGVTSEQMELALDILKRMAKMIHTEDGNEALIQEILRIQDQPIA